MKYSNNEKLTNC